MRNGQMEVGETFHIGGYDINARINYARGDGRIVVLCNNSSHFIVASRVEDLEIRQLADDYQFIESFSYVTNSGTGEAETVHQYRRALSKAVQIALSR